MTAITQNRMNVVLALAVPAMGLAYLTLGTSLTTNRSTISGLVALGVLWLTATVALNTARQPRRAGVSRVPEVRENLVPPRSVAWPAVVDVGRPIIGWRWTSLLLLPLELLAVAWSVPLVILSIMLPIGFAVATMLWVGRRILGL